MLHAIPKDSLVLWPFLAALAALVPAMLVLIGKIVWEDIQQARCEARIARNATRKRTLSHLQIDWYQAQRWARGIVTPWRTKHPIRKHNYTGIVRVRTNDRARRLVDLLWEYGHVAFYVGNTVEGLYVVTEAPLALLRAATARGEKVLECDPYASVLDSVRQSA